MLTAIARDAAGHRTPASVAVMVGNARPSQTLLTTQVPMIPGYLERDGAAGARHARGQRRVWDK